MKRVIGSVVALVFIAGCVSREQIARLETDEQANFYQAGLSTDEMLDRGLNLGNGYLALADQVSTTQDGVAVFNILLAAGAALAVVNDASTNQLARVGVAGLAVNQTSGYFEPVTARDSLTRAAKRNFCIVMTGRTLAANDGPAERKAIADALTRVKIFLREDLNREPNNFSDLFEAQTAAFERQKERAFDLALLQNELNKCVALS